MSSTFGTLFRVTTFGESHGKGVGAIVDGCPPGITLSETDIQPQLDRRRPGQTKLTTDREEADRVTILSGVENGKVLGTPIGMVVANKDQRPEDYAQMRSVPRMIITLGSVNEDESIGLTIRQGPQQNPVDNTEESRVRSYPEGQSGYGN